MASNVTIVAAPAGRAALAFTLGSLGDAGSVVPTVLDDEPRGLRAIAAGADSRYALSALGVLANSEPEPRIVVRAGVAFLRDPQQLIREAIERGIAAPQRRLPVADGRFEPSVRAVAAEGLGIPEVIAGAAAGRDLALAVVEAARRDLSDFHFDAPWMLLRSIAAYDPGIAVFEPIVLDLAWLADDRDIEPSCEAVVLPHWRRDRPWVPDGRAFFPRVTAVGRPALQAVLDRRSSIEVEHGPDADAGDVDALRDLARMLLVERVDVDLPVDVSVDAFEAWLAEPAEVAGLRDHLPRGLHLTWHLREDLRRTFPAIPGDDEPRLREWGKHDPQWAGSANTRILGDGNHRPAGSGASRWLHGLRGGGEAAVAGGTPVRDGVLVFGLLNAANGLGNVGRDLVETLRGSGVDVSRRTWDTSARAKLGPAVHDGPPRSTAIAVHGAQADYARFLDPDFLRADRRIGVVFWEIDCPIPGAEDFDRIYTELWAPSGFLAEVYRRQTGLPVHVMPQHAVFEGSERVDENAALRAEGAPYALFIFDHYSVMERKNPLGVIDAFVAAFSPEDGPRLVIKSINGDRYRRPHADLVRHAAPHPHVEVRDGLVSRAEVMRLAAGASAYVSLHRGEGLGLTIAEAMAMGVPGIATAYGGSLDFMREGNSHLVAFTGTPVGERGFPYPAEAVWADPDLEGAAVALRAALADPGAAALGMRGRDDVLAWFDRERQIRFLRARELGS